MDGVGLPEVDLVGRHQPDAPVMMVFRDDGPHYTRHRASAEDAGRVDGLEPLGEFWMIFQCLAVGLPRTGCHSRCVDGCGI